MSSHYLRLVALVSILSVFTFTSQVCAADQHKWGDVKDSEWSLTPPAAFPEAAAVVIFDIGKVDIPQPYDGNQIVFERHVRTKIFNKAGAEKAIAIEIPVYGSESFRGFDAQTILADGKKLKVEKDALLKKRSGKSLEYMTFTFPAVENGYIVEYKYKIWNSHYGSLDPWYFQGPYYTLESSFITDLAPGLNYTAITRNVPEELRKPVERVIGLDPSLPTEYTWTLHDIYPIEPESHMAAVNSYYASLCLQLISFKDIDNYVKFITDWPSLAKIVEENYTAPAMDKDKGVEDKARELAAGMTDTLEIVRRFCDFVRLEILTTDLESNFYLTPHGVDKVLSELRGIGTGKNLLLIQMLRKIGVTANPLLIGTRTFTFFNPQVYDLNQFDYLLCLVKVGSLSYLLDASDRWVPFPYIPFDALVTGGLVIDGDNSKIVSLNAPERKSGITFNTKMIVSADGSAVCSSHVNIAGHLLSLHKKILDETPNSREVKESLLKSQSLDFELVDYKMTEAPGEDSVGIDLVFELPDYCDLLDSNVTGEPLIFSLKDNPFKKPQRSFPVDFGYPYQLSETVDLVVSDSLQLETLPENLSLAVNGVRYTRFVVKADNQARIISQLIVSKSMFVPTEYAKLRETFEQLTEAATDPFIAGQK